MKAIYINLDPYLAQIAEWLKANPQDPDTGEYSAPLPSFDPLPLAVTVPLGADVGIIVPGKSDPPYSVYDVGGSRFFASLSPDASTFPDPPSGESVIDEDFGAGYTAFAYGTNTLNSVISVSGDSAAYTIYIFNGYDDSLIASVPFTVIVRRETASGPVDLVDFTPPASAIAAGTDLAGCKFDGNEIVANADTGALSAPAAGG